MPTYGTGRVIQEARGASITYEYNDKHYPTKALGADEVIFTYKQQ